MKLGEPKSAPLRSSDLRERWKTNLQIYRTGERFLEETNRRNGRNNLGEKSIEILDRQVDRKREREKKSLERTSKNFRKFEFSTFGEKKSKTLNQ